MSGSKRIEYGGRVERDGQVLRGQAARDERQRRRALGLPENDYERVRQPKKKTGRPLGRPRNPENVPQLSRHYDEAEAAPKRSPLVPPPTPQMRQLRGRKWSYAQIARVVGLTTPQVAAMFGEPNPMAFKLPGCP